MLNSILEGSVSSSIHCFPRRTQDVGIIVDIQLSQVRPLIQLFQNDYYLDEQALKDSVWRGFPYNVIHLNIMIKVANISFHQVSAKGRLAGKMKDAVICFMIGGAYPSFNSICWLASRAWSQEADQRLFLLPGALA